MRSKLEEENNDERNASYTLSMVPGLGLIRNISPTQKTRLTAYLGRRGHSHHLAMEVVLS